VFNALHLADLVKIGLVLHLPKFMVYYCFFSWLYFLVISVLVKRLAGKSVSDMTYIVSSGTLNRNSINLVVVTACFCDTEVLCIVCVDAVFCNRCIILLPAVLPCWSTDCLAVHT